jgi:hypothetical protein
VSRRINAVYKYGEGLNMDFYRGIESRGLFCTRLKTGLICYVVYVENNIFTREFFGSDNAAGLRRVAFAFLKAFNDLF